MRGDAANLFIKAAGRSWSIWVKSRVCVIPIAIRARWAGWFDGEWRWIADKNEAGGGGFADLGAHALDIVLWCLSPTCGPVVKTCCDAGQRDRSVTAI